MRKSYQICIKESKNVTIDKMKVIKCHESKDKGKANPCLSISANGD